MRVLILGGTQFVGRHIAEALLAAGHTVTIFNRGRTRDHLPPEVERLRGDRDAGPAGLTALAGQTWDVCVDVSGYTPRQVSAALDRLAPAAGHYVFLSAVSVYGDPATGPVTEEFPCTPPAAEEAREINQATYGPLKVACEHRVQERFPGRCTLLRPQIVAGPYDPLDRFSYWVRRATEAGEILAPGDGSDFLQFVDAEDLARFVGIVCEQHLTGTFNLAGPRLTWTEFLTVLGAENVTWVPHRFLAAAGLGEREVPLYRSTQGPRSQLMNVSHARARAAGLTLRSPNQTVGAVRRWLVANAVAPALSPGREVELLRRFRSA